MRGDVDFSGRSVVVTGVGRAGQVGEAVATSFAERGARVFLVGRDEREVNARTEQLLAAGRRAAALVADLADERAVATLAERVRDATGGRVHALVHLAGGFASSGAVAESDASIWSTQFSINATTAYLSARAFLPLVRATKGAIVFFASEAVLPGGRVSGVSAYAAAKSAVVSLMQSIAQEEGPRGVRSNAIAPTSIRTAANLESMGSDVAYVSREDVASLVMWLCSDDARAVNGQLIRAR